jgi:hypothetical protein
MSSRTSPVPLAALALLGALVDARDRGVDPSADPTCADLLAEASAWGCTWLAFQILMTVASQWSMTDREALRAISFGLQLSGAMEEEDGDG